MNEMRQVSVEITRNLKNIQHIMKNRLHNHFKSMELTAPQGMLVFMVSHHGQLKITEISEKMGLSNSTVSGIVDRLESQGYVERLRSKEDRRVVYVTTTPKMKEQVMFHENMLESIMEEALKQASEAELQQIVSGLELLNEILMKTHKGEINPC